MLIDVAYVPGTTSPRVVAVPLLNLAEVMASPFALAPPATIVASANARTTLATGFFAWMAFLLTGGRPALAAQSGQPIFRFPPT